MEYKCEICQRVIKNLASLSKHIRYKHKDITKEEYYNKYINPENKDKTCPVCGKLNKFDGLDSGYRKHCSSKCSTLDLKTQESMKKTLLENYGVEHPMFSQDIKDKVKQTCLDRYGVESPIQNEEVRNKLKQTCLDKYGVENSLSNKEVREKINKTFLEKYGGNPFQNEEIKEKIKETQLEKYGGNPSKSPIIKEKIKNVLLEKYHTTGIQSLPEMKEKVRKTSLEKFGVEHFCQNEDVKEKVLKTRIERFGSINIFNDPEVKKKLFATNMDRYGSNYYFNSESKKELFRKIYYDRLINSDRLKDLVKVKFTLEEYNGQKDNKYLFECNKCSTEFYNSLDNGRIPRCPTCYPVLVSKSNIEVEIGDYVKSIYDKTILLNDRTLLKNIRKELDIVIPDKNIAIEFNGLYWHSELNGKDKNYHLNKTEECQKLGYMLIHIFEDEWIEKKNIVKSIIRNKLGLIDNKIYARKCEIKEVNEDDSYIFLDNNHLQGYIGGKHFGLYFNDELVSILSIGKSRFNKKYDFEILRFCNKMNTIVVGGFSKLFKHVEEIFQNKSFITYVDRRFGIGNFYIKSGFKFISTSIPNYFYINKEKRFSRLHFQKHKLSKLLEFFDLELTEWQNMQLNGYDRIWDCGNLVYIKGNY